LPTSISLLSSSKNFPNYQGFADSEQEDVRVNRTAIFIFVLVLVLFFVGIAANAQVPTSGNVFFGYSYSNTDLSLNRGSLNGWEATLEGKIFPHVGIVADFSGHYGSLKYPTPAGTCPIGIVCSPISVSTHEEDVLFGPRVSVGVGRYTPFAEALFGVGHVSRSGFGTDTSWATGLGGGLDYRLIRFVAWRFQGDYIHTHLFSQGQNNLRLSTGIVVHF
jgi:hypothetical protein